MMNQKPPSCCRDIPVVGSHYIKLNTGEIVPWKSYNEATQTFEFESPEGVTKEVHRRDVEIATADDELEYLRANSQHSS